MIYFFSSRTQKKNCFLHIRNIASVRVARLDLQKKNILTSTKRNARFYSQESDSEDDGFPAVLMQLPGSVENTCVCFIFYLQKT